MFTHHVLEFVKKNLKKYNGNYLEIGVYSGGSISELSDLYQDKIIDLGKSSYAFIIK